MGNMVNLGTIKRSASFGFSISIKDKETNEAVTGAVSRLKCQGRYKDTRTAVGQATNTFFGFNF